MQLPQGLASGFLPNHHLGGSSSPPPPSPGPHPSRMHLRHLTLDEALLPGLPPPPACTSRHSGLLLSEPGPRGGGPGCTVVQAPPIPCVYG